MSKHEERLDVARHNLGAEAQRHSQRLDVARHSLDALSAHVDARVKLAQAHAEWTWRMLECQQKRVEIERDEVKLDQLRGAIRSFQKTRRESTMRIKRADQQRQRLRRSLKAINTLIIATERDPKLVGLAWVGYSHLIAGMAPMHAASIAVIPALADAREPANFKHPKSGESTKAPGDAITAVALMDHARRNSYLLVPGRPAYDLFIDIIQAISDFAKARLDKCNEKIKKMEADVRSLDAADWRVAEIAYEPIDIAD